MSWNAYRDRLIVALALALAGCAATPQPGGDDPVIRGAAAGEHRADADAQVPRCEHPLGTVGLYEEETARAALQAAQLDSSLPLPLLRLLIQQSNCFVVVERGRALSNLELERKLAQGAAVREAPTETPKLLAADYTLVASVAHAEPSGVGISTGVGGIWGRRWSNPDVSAELRTLGAATTLLLIHNGSGAQIAAAQGSARQTDVGAGIGLLGGMLGGLNVYATTPAGKIVAAAFLDAYRRLVAASRQYRAQSVTGAVGKGGALVSP